MKKADFILVREAGLQGCLVSIGSQNVKNQTPLNKQLANYFNSMMPMYTGKFNENEADRLLSNINSYIDENNIDMYLIDFPMIPGSAVHLLPITPQLQLKIMVVDEYYGAGDYSKYFTADGFIITDSTTTVDIDILIEFMKKHLE